MMLMCLLEIDVREMLVHFDNPMVEEHYHKMKDVSNRRHENVDEPKALLDARVIWLNVLTEWWWCCSYLLLEETKKQNHRTE